MASTTLNTISSYQRGTYPFPKDEIPTKDKDASWGRKFCEAMYASWISDRTGIPYSNMEELRILRKYGAGNQEVKKYMDILLDEADPGEEPQGYLNVNWEIFSVMPKFKHIIRGIFEEQEHSIVATAIDPKSVDRKELNKLRKWFKGRYKPLIDQVNKMAGYTPPQEWLPDTIDDIELHSISGGFKMAEEAEIEEGLDYTFYISDWKETKRKLIDDFADINCAAVKDFTDTYTKKVKTRYVDPMNLIIQYSRHWDHRNSEYAGEIIKETITNIRKNTDLLEEDLRNLAQFYNGRNANQNIASWTSGDTTLSTGGFKYDDFLIDIMDCEWFSVNEKFHSSRKDENGDTFKYDEDGVKVLNPKMEISSRYKTVYRCKWIIGTENTYDFGLQYDITRPGKKEVELSYKFYKLPGRSLVSLSVPNLDQIQITWLKMQNALAMSSNAGIAVEYTSLMNMKLGGEKMEPLEILSIRRDMGDLIYKMTTHHGKANIPGGHRPIQELQGGIGQQLDEFIRLFELNLEFIRDLTGINRIADASTPDPNQSVGGSQMAVIATTNALKPLYSGYIRLKEFTARSCALRIQLLLRHNKEAYGGYMPVVGGAGVKILSVGADAKDVDYSIKIEAKPTRERKQIILQSAMNSMQPDKDGFTGIEEKDFMMIERLLEAGNEKYAEMLLNYRSKKNKERQMQIQRENMEIDSKNQQKIAGVKAEEVRKNMKFESGLKIEEEKNKADLEDRNNEREHLRKLDQIDKENSYDTEEKQKQKTA